jgi:AsmA protein
MVLDGDTLSLESVELRLDATHAAGSALLSAPAMTGIGFGAAPTLVVALALDGLDLDPYLVETRSDRAADDPASTAVTTVAANCLLPALGTINAPVLPIADPNADPAADLIAYLEADKLRVGGLRYGRLAVDARVQAALAGADIKAADFYAGNLSARVERDARDAASPRQTLRAEGIGIDVAALLSDLQGKAPISGIGDIRAELTAAGADAAALKADLSGTVIAEVRDGRFNGLDIGTLVAAVGGHAADAIAATTFSTLTATAVGSGGLFVTKDIDGRSKMLRVSGQGRFDVPAESMDLDLDATFVEGATGARDLGGIRVPLSISGPWRQPAFRADFGAALREGARRALDRNRDTLKQIEERTGIKGLEQGLRGLFGR